MNTQPTQPQNLVSLLPQFATQIKDYGIGLIFIENGEVYITSIWELDESLVSAIELEVLRLNYLGMSLDECRAIKKEKYSNVDISTAMSNDEKALTSVIAQKFSELNQAIKEKKEAAKKAETHSLEVGQVIKGENCRLVVTAVKTTTDEPKEKNKSITVESFRELSNFYNVMLDNASANLKKITDGNRSACGLTNDKTKSTSEYKKAKQAYDAAFTLLRNFNKSVPNKIKQRAWSRK